VLRAGLAERETRRRLRRWGGKGPTMCAAGCGIVKVNDCRTKSERLSGLKGWKTTAKEQMLDNQERSDVGRNKKQKFREAAQIRGRNGRQACPSEKSVCHRIRRGRIYKEKTNFQKIGFIRAPRASMWAEVRIPRTVKVRSSPKDRRQKSTQFRE